MFIAEDDPAVRYVYERQIDRVPGFTTVGAAESGEQVVAELMRTPAHLLLLDLTLRGMDGLAVLRDIRARRTPIEAIVVTASRNADVVRALVHLGVVDYLVKPFPPERLHQALALFRHRMIALADDPLNQENVDQVCASGRQMRRWLPRGLTVPTLLHVKRALNEAPEPATAEDVATRARVARVTARRYLEYLVTTDQARSRVVPDGPGRPTKTYWSGETR